MIGSYMLKTPKIRLNEFIKKHDIVPSTYIKMFKSLSNLSFIFDFISPFD